MKFNVEIELDWVDDEYTVDDAVKEELVRQTSLLAGEILAKQDFVRITQEEEFRAAQQAYNVMVDELRSDAQRQREAVLAKVDTVFADFLAGKAFSVNSWGQPTKEYTVGEFIQDQIELKIKDLDKTLAKFVEKEVSDKMRLTERGIRTLVEDKSKEIQNENAKAVAEFIVKGLK